MKNINNSIYILAERELRGYNENTSTFNTRSYEMVILKLSTQGKLLETIHTSLDPDGYYRGLSYHDGIFYIMKRNYLNLTSIKFELLGLNEQGDLLSNQTYPYPVDITTASMEKYDIYQNQIVMNIQYHYNDTFYSLMEIRRLNNLRLIERSDYPYANPYAITWQGSSIFLTMRYLAHRSNVSGGVWGLNVIEFDISDSFNFGQMVSSVFYSQYDNTRNPVYTYKNQTEPLSIQDFLFNGEKLYQILGLGTFEALEISNNTYSEVIIGIDIISITSAYPAEVLPQILVGSGLIL